MSSTHTSRLRSRRSCGWGIHGQRTWWAGRADLKRSVLAHLERVVSAALLLLLGAAASDAAEGVLSEAADGVGGALGEAVHSLASFADAGKPAKGSAVTAEGAAAALLATAASAPAGLVDIGSSGRRAARRTAAAPRRYLSDFDGK